MKTVSVISKNNLDVTFDGVPCLLRRTKRRIIESNGITTMEVVTDRVTFEDVEIPLFTDVEILDENNVPTGTFEPQLDENGNQITETKRKLVSHSVRDSNGIGRLTEQQMNELAEAVKPLIPTNATESERRYIQESQGLLFKTISEKIYGTTEWEIYTGE